MTKLRSEKAIAETLPAACRTPARFLLSSEISTIYKRDGRTRKVHHLLYAPSLEVSAAITASLAKIGNLASDGRPILGLDSRDLLEITLEAGGYLIPAHAWTPWFAVLGSQSGFDRGNSTAATRSSSSSSPTSTAGPSRTTSSGAVRSSPSTCPKAGTASANRCGRPPQVA